MTVDSGDVWVVLWNGGAVARYAPDGSLRETVPVPVDRPTSCAFGGQDGATLFVTTSRGASTPPPSPASRTRDTCCASTAWESPDHPARPTEPRNPTMKLLVIGAEDLGVVRRAR